MTENQKALFKALEVIDNSILFLEDAQGIVNDMDKKEVEEVVEKFSKEIIEFDEDNLYESSSQFEGYANSIITAIVNKLKEK